MSSMTEYEKDPRPDLNEDHGYWIALLTVAKERSQKLFGILHALRCGGARLVKDIKTGLRILPGEWEPERYNEYKVKYLRPNVNAIKSLLVRASRVNTNKLTTREDVISRIKAIEPKAKSLGWTHQEIWAEKEFEVHGWRTHSIFDALMFDPHAEITAVTSEFLEFSYRYPNGHVVKNRLYRRPPAEQPQLFATSKKEAV